MHGLVMKSTDVDYSDLTKYGRVVVKETNHGIGVEVSGFVFDVSGTCRQEVVKAMAWARDTLDAAIAANLLVPGGCIVASTD